MPGAQEEGTIYRALAQDNDEEATAEAHGSTEAGAAGTLGATAMDDATRSGGTTVTGALETKADDNLDLLRTSLATPDNMATM
eukprot:11609585-Heterocapsa_arctica.AAC.1